MIDPPIWDEQRLERDRREAIALFRKERLEEPVDLYASLVQDQRAVVDALLEATADLRDLDDAALLRVLTDDRARDAFRYLAGPPVSQDDWRTLAEAGSMAAARLRDDPGALRRLAGVILESIDAERFPWIAEKRCPTPAERDAAVLASACMWAYQRTQTERRSSGKKRLEGATEQRLLQIGFRPAEKRSVRLLRDAPEPGTFCGEVSVVGRRSDFVLGLWDGRHALIECKDSNSMVNSIKRLNNDTAAKADFWLKQLGSRSVVPVAVISGVFSLDSLRGAQEMGLRLFWAHEMNEFAEWLKRIKATAQDE